MYAASGPSAPLSRRHTGEDKSVAIGPDGERVAGRIGEMKTLPAGELMTIGYRPAHFQDRAFRRAEIIRIENDKR